MPAFAYRAIDSGGRRSRGRLEAGSADELRHRLYERGLLLLSERRVQAGASRGSWSPFAARGSLVETTRALASLIAAGMPLTAALRTTRSLSRGDLAEALEEVRARVERGESVAAALTEYPRFFDPFFVGAVRAGERSSDLAGAFARLADHVERQEEVRQRLISASIYPLILASVGGFALIALLLFVVPRFVELIENTGAGVPPSTSVLLAVSTALRAWWPVLLACAVASPLALMGLRARPEGRRLLSAAILRLPLVGALRREVLAARFARLVAVLLRGGAPLLQALDDAAGSIADVRAAEELTRVRARVRGGVRLSVAVEESAFFPDLLARLTAVGEEAGRLTEFLERAAVMLEERTRRAAERTVTLLEPAMIVAFGGIVALVALTLLQAVYGLNAGGR